MHDDYAESPGAPKFLHARGNNFPFSRA